jgi:hypothetical protein
MYLFRTTNTNEVALEIIGGGRGEKEKKKKKKEKKGTWNRGFYLNLIIILQWCGIKFPKVA